MIDERLRFEKNRTPYLLILLFIGLNTLYSILILNAMAAVASLGVFVILTIVLLLLGFLVAVKVHMYSISWSYGAIVLGIFQISRILFTTNNLEGMTAVLMNGVLLSSGVLCAAAGLISRRISIKRKNLLAGRV
ncbi:MAG: hypothetical protein PQJ50_18515 [Spirochaetales bacterium]|nr:hypothetical protein [Spirochaetales bacterium]